MNLTLYKMTPLEEWITAKYLEHSICLPEDLEINRVADVFGGEITYLRTRSHARWEDDGTSDFMIILDSRLDEPSARSEFFHELCHPLRHVGDQKMLPKAFRDLQETQASLFQQYAAIPFFMVQDLDIPVYEKDIPLYLAHVFNVPVSLANRRFNQIKGRISQEEYSQRIASYCQSIYSKADPVNWSQETKKLFSLAIQRKLQKGQGVVVR
ncbi:ImmA/IrrE family metallo-endopeptidase [Brevibacillus sp. HD1.4A]|uniref:ImmA/IrrE family metallo-endopeptidase n=1 Tax=Brevibacillus sp. HD1.4A TaxID=2738978 RepID=UPI00156BBFE0|nr:ImmA/IrrE family metallo-endopeptidase [Brevibacillus sp. HD1.4A]NRQ56084.1 ImmA/IrrE family metallo-endopeptidase [Brevibacillus sp. HD1.4A]